MGTRCIAPKGVNDGRIGRKEIQEREGEIFEKVMEGKRDREGIKGKGTGRVSRERGQGGY